MNNPGVQWEMAAAESQSAPKDAKGKIPAPGDVSPDKKQVEAYGNYTSRDEFIWNQEYEKFVAEGNRIFHDTKAFGGTVGISCDMPSECSEYACGDLSEISGSVTARGVAAGHD